MFAPTIASLFDSAARKYPNRLAVAFDGRRWTYREWHERVLRLAETFVEMGIGHGDRVALFLRTSEATALAYLASQMLGAVAVPMNFRLSGGEAVFILRDADARLLVFDATVNEPMQRIAAELPGLLLLPADQIDALIERSPPLADPSRPSAGDVAALVYTSGTTGQPKGVIHTQANDVAIVQNCVIEYGLNADDVALHIAPLYHVGGMQAFFLPHLMVGAANIIATRYQPLQTLADIRAERVTTLFAVPTQIQDMLLHPRFGEFDHASLRLITTGGAALPAATMARVIDEFCAGVYNGYGMTEASLTLVLPPRDVLMKLGSCGQPSFVSECRLVALEGNEEPAQGEVGELWVRGPQMSPGYWRRPAETAKKFQQGWLRTGDLFSRDAEGYYFFQGRADDLIVTGGENVYPREVEEVLYRCPGVQEAAVVGLPDPRWGQMVTAFVVRRDPALKAEHIDSFCRASDELAAFKRPRRIEFLPALPMNPSGKVLKRELLARASA